MQAQKSLTKQVVLSGKTFITDRFSAQHYLFFLSAPTVAALPSGRKERQEKKGKDSNVHVVKQTDKTVVRNNLRELSNILIKLRIIGVSYNEAVKTLKSYHIVATAQRMIHQLEKYSAVIINLQVQAIQLTMAFDNREKK